MQVSVVMATYLGKPRGRCVLSECVVLFFLMCANKLQLKSPTKFKQSDHNLIPTVRRQKVQRPSQDLCVCVSVDQLQKEEDLSGGTRDGSVSNEGPPAQILYIHCHSWQFYSFTSTAKAQLTNYCSPISPGEVQCVDSVPCCRKEAGAWFKERILLTEEWYLFCLSPVCICLNFMVSQWCVW